MAITSSAKRAIRTASRRRVFNLRRMNTMHDTVKTFQKLVIAGKLSDAEKDLPAVYRALDKAAKRGVITKNTAARKKSRLVAFLRRHSKKK